MAQGPDDYKGYMNIPNLLTSIRIMLIPIFVFLYTTPSRQRSLVAASIFIIAAITDLLDGYVARRMGQITRLGKLLDPIADKLLVSSALILLVGFQRVHTWIALLIIGREIAVTGLRAVAASEGIIISSDKGGKAKMAMQIFAITLLIIDADLGSVNLHLWGELLLILSMVLSFISGGQYFVRFWSKLDSRKK